MLKWAPEIFDLKHDFLTKFEVEQNMIPTSIICNWLLISIKYINYDKKSQFNIPSNVRNSWVELTLKNRLAKGWGAQVLKNTWLSLHLIHVRR